LLLSSPEEPDGVLVNVFFSECKIKNKHCQTSLFYEALSFCIYSAQTKLMHNDKKERIKI
jgi:hypothetical protein